MITLLILYSFILSPVQQLVRPYRLRKLVGEVWRKLDSRDNGDRTQGPIAGLSMGGYRGLAIGLNKP